MDMKEIAKRLVDARANILASRAFFGRLLMNLPLKFTDCGTACTDMKSIMFDPAFVEELSDKELTFVYLHELMHCVLKHCTRGKGKLQNVYNTACDIVVNSVILESMGETDMSVAGHPVMHLAPSGKEGKEYTAEEVYSMLIKDAVALGCGASGGTGGEKSKGDGDPSNQSHGSESDCAGAFSDSHEIWQTVKSDTLAEGAWDAKVAKASKAAGCKGISPEVNRIINIAKRNTKIDWRYLLSNIIKKNLHGYDYYRPDRRFSGEDFVLPSYTNNIRGSHVENVWVLADTSGSITPKALNAFFSEIKGITEQIDSVEGFFSYFDVKVSEPVPFETIEDIEKLTVKGGGGTSFKAIFRSVKSFFPKELPRAIIIITDGYATFPTLDEMLGAEVIWIITDSDVHAPCGETIHVSLKEDLNGAP